MAKVKSLAELKAMREKLQSTLDLREKSNDRAEARHRLHPDRLHGLLPR